MVPGNAPNFADNVDLPDAIFPHNKCKVGFSDVVTVAISIIYLTGLLPVRPALPAGKWRTLSHLSQTGDNNH
jgi:hypothetical protein